MKENENIPNLCTTDCIHYCKGTCPFLWFEKYEKCPLYIRWKQQNEEKQINNNKED